jgi:ubiquinol-cytochrome c reductase subunit 7
MDGRGLLSNNSLELLFRRTAAKMALRMVTDKIMGFAAKQYQNVLGNQLAQYGLRYEDILIEEEREVKEALSLADPDVLTGRTRRLKRAIDLNYKRKSLQDYAPNMELDLFKREIYPDIEKIRARDQEYAQLNSHNKQ